MNCRLFRKRQVELLDTNPDPIATSDLRRHMDICPECAREFGELQALLASLTPSQRVCASSKLKEGIMERIDDADAVQPVPKISWVQSRFIRVAFAAILLFGIVAGSDWMATRSATAQLETLAMAAESMSSVKSINITAQMRTRKGDNFDYCEPSMAFEPVEIWEEISAGLSKWRVQKPGRSVVNDGQSTLLVMQLDTKDTVAAKLPPNAVGTIGWLSPLLHIDNLLTDEQEIARRQQLQVSIEKKADSTGTPVVVLTINAKAQGNFSQSDYMKNKTILESDNTRVYTFDAATHRLRGMRVYMNINGSKVLVFKTAGIQYDTPIVPALFSTEVPKGARLVQLSPTVSGNTAKTPEEATEAIFSDMSKRDWTALHAYAGNFFDDPKLQDMFGGLRIISIGTAFRSGIYPGWFVPYQIQLVSGQIKKGNLAVRNDNPKHLWMLDGGL